MQGLGNLDVLTKNCTNLMSIKDINVQYSYEDKIGGGNTLEWQLLSCGQDGSTNGYNELERFYDTHIPEKFKGLNSLIAIKALCECCRDIPHKNRTHEKFKKCVFDKLGIKL